MIRVVKQEPQGALIAHLSTMSTSVKSYIFLAEISQNSNNGDISIQDMGMHSVCCCCILIWRRSPLEKRPLTDLFNTHPVMYASGIYVTGLVPCLVNAVDFLLYKLHVLVSELQSPVIYTVCTPWNSIFKCISYAQTINITPTWIHLWADLAEKPKRMSRAMITSSLPSLVNIHQSVL